MSTNNSVRFLCGTGKPKIDKDTVGCFFFDTKRGIFRLNDNEGKLWKYHMINETSGATYSSLEEMSWQQIAELSDSIGAGGPIPEWLKVSNYNDTTNPAKGDYRKCSKPFTIDGQEYIADVIGINRHTLSNGTTAGITFGMRTVASSLTAPMKGPSYSGAGSYQNSYTRNYLNNLARGAANHTLDLELRKVLAPVKIPFINSSHTVTYANDKLWLFSATDLFGYDPNYYSSTGIGSTTKFNREAVASFGSNQINQTTRSSTGNMYFWKIVNNQVQPINVDMNTKYWTRSICQAGCVDYVVIDINGKPQDNSSNSQYLNPRFGFCVSAKWN